jgi:hypothetical protein
MVLPGFLWTVHRFVKLIPEASAASRCPPMAGSHQDTAADLGSGEIISSCDDLRGLVLPPERPCAMMLSSLYTKLPDFSCSAAESQETPPPLGAGLVGG